MLKEAESRKHVLEETFFCIFKIATATGVLCQQWKIIRMLFLARSLSQIRQ